MRSFGPGRWTVVCNAEHHRAFDVLARRENDVAGRFATVHWSHLCVLRLVSSCAGSVPAGRVVVCGVYYLRAARNRRTGAQGPYYLVDAGSDKGTRRGIVLGPA